jgi:hypothetical protein
MPLDIEGQKLRDVKSFYNKLNHSKLYGPRNIFDSSIYRLTNMTGKKLVSFIEVKPINVNAVINIGFDLGELNKHSINLLKYNKFIYGTFNDFISQIRSEPTLQYIKVIYYSIHNNLISHLSNVIIGNGFTPVISKTEVSANKLPTDGIHSNYKLILRK